MFKRKRTRQIEDFGVALARDFAVRCPLGEVRQDTRKTVQLARAVDDVCNRAAAYQRERELGMYGKAALGTSFKLELKALGYPEELIDDLTRQMLLTMSGK